MKTKTKKSPAKSNVSHKRGFAGVWHASDWTDCHVGYLVTLPADLDRPIAFIDISFGGDLSQVLDLAQSIVVDPQKAWRHAGTGAQVIDLRNCSRCEPYPRFIYSLRCIPLNDFGLPLDVEPKEPTPFCQFLWNELSERTCDLASTAAERLMPHAK